MPSHLVVALQEDGVGDGERESALRECLQAVVQSERGAAEVGGRRHAEQSAQLARGLATCAFTEHCERESDRQRREEEVGAAVLCGAK